VEVPDAGTVSAADGAPAAASGPDLCPEIKMISCYIGELRSRSLKMRIVAYAAPLPATDFQQW
jgi:hypothetical protein